MAETIRFETLMALLKRKVGLIIGATLFGLVVGLIFTFWLLTPNYKSIVQVVVTQETESAVIQNTEVQANIQLVNTYNEIIKSPFIIEKVVSAAKGDYTVSELSSKVKVRNETNSQVINISVEAEKKEESIYLANIVAETFKHHASEVMKVGAIHILANSKYSTNSTRKSPFLYVFCATLIGFISGVSSCFIIAAIDTTLKTEEDILEQLALPVLGTVGKIKVEKGRMT